MRKRPIRRDLLRRRARLACVLGAVLVVIGFAAHAAAPGMLSLPLHLTSSPAKQPVATSFTDAPALGIAAGSSLTALSDAQVTARLDGIQASGARWIRLDFDWSLIQPDGPTQFTWATYDRLVADISSRHLGILAILDYTPLWARSGACATTSHCAPADPASFANFAAHAAARYSSQGVHYWEIWNEPNNPDFWQPAANPAQYVRLLQPTYQALHHTDPQAYVITAGLSPQATTSTSYSPYDFLNGVYQAGGSGSFDAVGDHPYTFPLSPAAPTDQAWNQMAGASRSLRSLMLAHGDGAKKIWITEFGAPTGGPGPVASLANPNLGAHPYVVDQALQAKILSDALQLYGSYAWAGPFFYYTYQDPGTDPSTNENFFGLITAGGTPKQAYEVFRNAATRYNK